jgi:exodeoxyribonuclease VII small subunit
MSKTPAPPSSPKTFESALAELEKIVDSMEGGQLPLEESIAAYRRGAHLLQYCQNALKDASQQVKVLEAGILKDFSADGESPVADGSD